MREQVLWTLYETSEQSQPMVGGNREKNTNVEQTQRVALTMMAGGVAER